MGVKLKDLSNPRKTSFENLSGNKIAIDGFNIIYQFLTTIRGPTGEPLMNSKGKITSHLTGLFYRNINLLNNNIEPIYVLDGKPPQLKSTLIKKRKETREKNQEKYILPDHGEIINNYNKKQFNDLPLVFGENADKIFFTFYPSLEAAGFEIELIKYFNYIDIKRWDIILKNGKLIKLPSTNYEKSLKKFLSIYETENFKKFRVFDFRVNEQLIIK